MQTVCSQLNEWDIESVSMIVNELGNKELVDYTIRALAEKINTNIKNLDKYLLYYVLFAFIFFLINKDVIDIKSISYVSINKYVALVFFAPVVLSVIALQYNQMLFYNIYDRYIYNILNMINYPIYFNEGLHDVLLNKHIFAFPVAARTRMGRAKSFFFFGGYVLVLNIAIIFSILYGYYVKLDNVNHALAIAATALNALLCLVMFGLIVRRIQWLEKCF